MSIGNIPEVLSQRILVGTVLVVRLGVLGNFASQDFDICLRNYCGSFADNCGD